MADRITKADCIKLIAKTHAEITAAGEDRLPRRSDFSEEEVIAIKAFFGPWPRALEAAGVKPPRAGSAAAASREKRIRAKRRINALRREISDKDTNI